jgi:hypothetical protein
MDVNRPGKVGGVLSSLTLNLNKMLFPSVENPARGLYPAEKQNSDSCRQSHAVITLYF